MKNEVILSENHGLDLVEVHPLITPQVSDAWLGWLDCQAQSKVTHERNLRAFRIWSMEQGIHRPVKKDLERYRDEMLKNHTANTVKNYLVSLKSFFSFLEEVGIYKEDISRKVKLPRLPKSHLKEPLTPEQIRVLMDGCEDNEKGLRDRAIVALMACTGLRVNAVREADISDLRLKNGQWVLEYLQKGYASKSGFYVEIPDDLYRLIVSYMDVRFAGADWSRSREPLFTSQSRNNQGNRATQQGISGMIKKRMRDAGINDPHYSAHSLRHSFATISSRAGASREAIQQIMGHQDSRTTERYIKDDARTNNQTISLVTKTIFGSET